jgi:hypothetical protein
VPIEIAALGRYATSATVRVLAFNEPEIDR